MARDRGHEIAHQLSRAHMGGDRGDEHQMSQVGRADRREWVPDIVGRQRHRDAGLQQPANRREAATDVSLVVGVP